MPAAIFLGAGASAATKLIPTQASLLREYLSGPFKKSRHGPIPTHVGPFLKSHFGIDIHDKTADVQNYPTFEEILGILDLARQYGETLGAGEQEFEGKSSPVIQKLALEFGIPIVRLYFLLLLAEMTHPEIGSLLVRETLHSKLVSKLKMLGLLSDTVFVTTNYDLLIDAGLWRCKIAPDYGSEDFRHIWPPAYYKPNLQAALGDLRRTLNERPTIKVLKLHGSVNWLHCPVCHVTRYLLFRSLAKRLLSGRDSDIRCESCQRVGIPIIVPPTYFKTNDVLGGPLPQIWREAEQSLLGVSHVIFCGYSFPDADIHVKYLIKRAQVRNQNRLAFTVINNHDDKRNEDRIAEAARFRRFLGEGVSYSNFSFQEFASDPERLWSGSDRT